MGLFALLLIGRLKWFRMFSRLVKKLVNRLNAPTIQKLESIKDEIEQNRILLGRQYAFSLQSQPILRLSDAEFKVFSQWGEDGIIQYLISRIPIPNKIFIEFGVENYRESNTRFLLVNNNWSGLVLDGSAQKVEQIRSMPLYWRHDLEAKCAFVTAENINSLIEESGIQGDIGLLSIDIDGNDYWVWKAIDERIVYPRIVIVEYNSLFGNGRAVGIPYRPDFQRSKAHYSNLYYGASLKAFCQLAREKGYSYVGSNSAGSNAFFVRADVVGDLPVTDCECGYIESKVREARDENGNLIYLSGAKRLDMIAHLPVVDLESGETITIGIVDAKEKERVKNDKYI